MQSPAGISRHAAPAPSQIRVIAPARLHFGFVDLHGGLGRRFGSLGLAIERPMVRLRAFHGSGMEAIGPGAERVARALNALQQRYGIGPGVRVEIEEAIPPHAGLGSGTQITLAAAAAVCALSALSVPVTELARVLQRGARSGIGSGVFELGGFVVDGGRGDQDRAPPVISRLPFPEEWRVVLAFDPELTGLHGEREAAAFRDLPQFPEREAERLARLVLMQLLPALAEARLDQFGAALTELQRTIGDHFAPAQGGRYASRRVESTLQQLAGYGAAACGQSSWGPTGFAIFGGQAAAEAAIERLCGSPQDAPPASVQVVRGCNRGAQMQPLYATAGQAVAA
ncbi:MAG TPA: beta-ribofuranosylaminobenzene 5'-phosphate synthase family protein [Burkholderiaceae bacterium]|nr:beta-ribofuranosylaminobenzene 5'-phosphate synthase family protein [Burkholderiaceae bacterium]